MSPFTSNAPLGFSVFIPTCANKKVEVNSDVSATKIVFIYLSERLNYSKLAITNYKGCKFRPIELYIIMLK
ncbi:hypothetical protein EB1_12250 [Empedobacter brevis NBRC 14943 = ATCC 43319]|uniref:Uncharacterized protein n=1 Tax=Empedobacter brevis NBRC 14943 = ATCC 43319 TaxID=1218108 RepID=A0A511NF63_9FLAO|nr:hypothetical protein EB1_12250 [Empedobacter brevis NBRC 14943 = ATCC 43319]